MHSIMLGIGQRHAVLRDRLNQAGGAVRFAARHIGVGRCVCLPVHRHRPGGDSPQGVIGVRHLFVRTAVILKAGDPVLLVIPKGGRMLLPCRADLLGKDVRQFVCVAGQPSGVHVSAVQQLRLHRRSSGQVVIGIRQCLLLVILQRAHPAGGVVAVGEAVGGFAVMPDSGQAAEAVGLSIVLFSISSTY